MRIADRLMTKAEEVAFRELKSIADDNGFRLFAKPRLSDVLWKGVPLPPRTFDFYTRVHVDFAICDAATRPIMLVEYDGPFHAHAKQQERDRIVNGGVKPGHQGGAKPGPFGVDVKLDVLRPPGGDGQGFVAGADAAFRRR
jgi:hypothetical protein